MLASCVIFLKIKDEALVPPAMGQVLHAFFLDKVRDMDSGLAEELHKPVPIKPFTISPLWGKNIYENNRWRLSPAEDYSFRITSISPALSRWLMDTWAPSLPGKIILAGTEFDMCGFTFDKAQHPWAGISFFEDIYNSAVAGSDVNYKLALQFYSPTTFRSQGINYPLPDPQRVFANLLYKWNLYAPVHLGDDFTDFIAANMFPAAYKLTTRIMHFSNYKQVGFVGQCSYGIRRQSEDIMVRVVHILADFAFYAGVGYKTTMGMGQTRLVE